MDAMSEGKLKLEKLGQLVIEEADVHGGVEV
jgi:hypothetical protein